MTPDRLSTNSRAMTDALESFSRVVDETTRLGIDLLDSYSRLLQSSARSAPGQITRNLQNMMGAVQNIGTARIGASCCHIPPPCWLPKPIGDVVSHVCPGATATLRICVTNCGFTQQTVTVEAPANSGVTVTPASFTLGPLQRACVTLTLAKPTDTQSGQETEYLIWVRGCKIHYLRWTVAVSSRGACTCHEVEVDDCPDLIHHWYDHFYCRRPCTNQTRTGGQ
jgi:hypothetical protein